MWQALGLIQRACLHEEERGIGDDPDLHLRSPGLPARMPNTHSSHTYEGDRETDSKAFFFSIVLRLRLCPWDLRDKVSVHSPNQLGRSLYPGLLS